MKLLSLAPSNTEILFALGAGKDIVGVTKFCDYPDDAKYKPKVGGWLDVKIEAIEKLKPDLIFTSNSLQAEHVERLSKRGFNVVHVDPRNLKEVYESIITIGESINKTERAEGLVFAMQKRINAIASLNKQARKIKVYCEEWHKPPTVAGNWVPEIIELCGGVSFSKAGKKSYEVEADEIAKFNPSVVIASWSSQGRRANPKAISARPIWNKIPAFKDGRVFIIDDCFLDRPSPRLSEGAEKISSILEKVRKHY